MALRVAARYKSKKTLETGTRDEYGPRQVANRNRQKAERVESFGSPSTNFGRRSNRTSRRRPEDQADGSGCGSHRPHVRARWERGFGRRGSLWGHGLATSARDLEGHRDDQYVGKSGVKHEKVKDGTILSALRSAYDAVEGNESGIFAHKDATVSSKEVNEYLKDFDITAKDLRGFHANREMQERLKAIRSKGPELPRERKAKDKILKSEFKKALEGTAEAVGHEASTLRSQYLVPSLEEAYLHDGSVIEKLNEKVAMECSPDPPLLFANRSFASLWITWRRPIHHRGDGLQGHPFGLSNRRKLARS